MAKRVSELLAALRQALPEINGAMVASVDGHPIAHDFPDGDADNLAAMAATTLGLGQRVAQRVDIGDLAETVFRGSNGYLVVYAIGHGAVLVMSAPRSASLGLMRIEARVTALEMRLALSSE